MNKTNQIQKPKVSRKHFIHTLAAITLIYTTFHAISICEYGKKDDKTPSDTTIILGASVTGENPSPVFRERINHGIWLYNNGYTKTLIFTGGYSPGNKESDATIAKRYALNQGIPPEAIYIEEKSTITLENLLYARDIMEENNLKTAIIVSDPLHMKRSMLMAADLDIEAHPSPTPTTRYISFRSKFKFLSRELFFYIAYRITRLAP